LAFAAVRPPFVVTDAASRTPDGASSSNVSVRSDRLHTLPHLRRARGRAGSARADPSFHGIFPHLGSPPPMSPCGSTPRPLSRPFGAVGPPRHSFRPRGFAPPRRLPPHTGSGRVASRYRTWGSLGFAADRRDSEEVGRFRAPLQRMTLRRFSLAGSRSPSLGPLPSCRSSLTRRPSLRPRRRVWFTPRRRRQRVTTPSVRRSPRGHHRSPGRGSRVSTKPSSTRHHEGWSPKGLASVPARSTSRPPGCPPATGRVRAGVRRAIEPGSNPSSDGSGRGTSDR
jgi:hypothetical protein